MVYISSLGFDWNIALLLIDLQNDFCRLEGTANKRGKDVTFFQETFQAMTSLLQATRKKTIPIIHVISEHSVWSESPSKIERFGRKNQQIEYTYCTPGSWGARIYHLLQPQPEEKVITKHRYSAFYQTNLELILQTGKIEHIILTGLYTNVCIDTTARDGFMRDFQVNGSI